jgi:hypothetical protein
MVGRKRKASAKKKAADAAVDHPTPAIVPTIEEVQEPVPPAQPPLPTQEEELNTRAPAYRWFDASERALLEALQEAIRRGEQSDTGFHVRVWDRVIEGFVSKGFATITRDQLKNKVVYFKGRWKLFNQLANLSGWGIDEDNDQLLASDELWAAAITRKATYKQFYNKPLKYRKILDEIFDGTAATGEYSQTADDAVAESIIDEVPRARVAQFEEVDGEGFEDLLYNDSQLGFSSEPTPGLMTPEPSSQYKRKQSAQVAEGSSRKRSRNQGTDVIKELMLTMRERHVPGTTAKAAALRAFQRDYSHLNMTAKLQIINCFDDTQKVMTFNELEGEVRDAWIESLTSPF